MVGCIVKLIALTLGRLSIRPRNTYVQVTSTSRTYSTRSHRRGGITAYARRAFTEPNPLFNVRCRLSAAFVASTGWSCLILAECEELVTTLKQIDWRPRIANRPAKCKACQSCVSNRYVYVVDGHQFYERQHTKVVWSIINRELSK